MGVRIGENDMYTDFGMILTDLSLEMPEVKTPAQAFGSRRTWKAWTAL